VDDNTRCFEGPAESDDTILTRMVNFIVKELVKVIDPLQPEPVVAIAETAERINDTRWFWVDDTGKTAELFAVPSVRDAHPALADATLDYVLRLSPELIIQRRAAVPELRLVDANPERFRAYNSFFNLAGDLTRGVICPSIRFNDNRNRMVAQYSGTVAGFRYWGRRQTIDIAGSIESWSILEHADRIVFSHTSVIEGKPLIGARKHVCDVTYSYTLWRARSTVEVLVALTTVPGVTLDDVSLTTAFDQLSQGGAFQTAIVGRGDEFQMHSVPGEASVALTTKPADYLSLFESAVMPGFAIGLHAHLKQAAKLDAIVAEGSLPGHFHRVYARYALGKVGGGETRSIAEDRLLTGGGYYSQPEIYRRAVIAAETGTGEIDPSMSYDIGAELNAVAATILFANRGLYSVSPLSRERLHALKDWYDRHLSRFLTVVRPGEPDEHQRVFVRGLSFIILSLDCMARAYEDGGYRAKLEICVQLLLRLEVPVGGAFEESLFATHGPDDPPPPELDCQSAALLALARAAYWGDPDRRISDAIRRGLRGIVPTYSYADQGEQKTLVYESIAVRKKTGGRLRDTGYWNFKLGLSLRAFNAIRQIQDFKLLALDPQTLKHLDLLTKVSRRAIVPSVRWNDVTAEVLTCQRAGETNSETQPWVALGLVPAIEWAILGKPPALGAVPASDAPAAWLKGGTLTTDLQSATNLQDIVDSYHWWHSIDLGGGVITNGIKAPALMQLEYKNIFSKIDLVGRTVLDVGAWNGGFAVEAWRRGAASVTGLDHHTWNDPHFRGKETFNLISDITASNLKPIDRNLDDPRLDLSDLGQFDVVLFLGVFYHLKNPLSALREVSRTVRDVLVLETHVERFSTDRPAMVFYPGAELAGDSENWWGPNTACIVALLKLMGFARIEITAGSDDAREVFHAYRTSATMGSGVPHDS
jgi:SAM-dependent methyltransferase